MAFEMEIFNYSLPAPVTSQPALAGVRDVALLRQVAGITVWEAAGTLISNDRA